MKSKEVIDDQGLQYHIKCKKGDIGRYVILPGDPFRTDYFAGFLRDAKLIAHNREHKTWTGYVQDEKVSITSTGMGGPSAAIAVEELIHCGADTFIRIGTAGPLADAAFDKAVNGVIATSAVRNEGTTLEYVPVGYPAVSDAQVLQALLSANNERGSGFIAGIVESKDSFYGQFSPESMPMEQMLNERVLALKKANVLCTEMESAIIMVVSAIRGCRACSVLSFGAMEESIKLVISAIEKLIAGDKLRG